MDDKQKKILIVAALVVIAIVVYLFVSKKNDDQQGDAVADAMQQAADKVAQAAQANSDTAKQIESNNSTASKQRWITNEVEPNDGEIIYVAKGKSVKVLKDNSSKAKTKKTVSASADCSGYGVEVGAVKKKNSTSSYWKLGLNQWIRKGDYRNKDILYVLR